MTIAVVLLLAALILAILGLVNFRTNLCYGASLICVVSTLLLPRLG